MQAAKDASVKGLTGGIEHLFKKNKVDYVKGWGQIKDPTRIDVSLKDGSTQGIEAQNIIIATGSEPASLPGGALTIDEQ